MTERITAKKCKEYLDYLGRMGKFPTHALWRHVKDRKTGHTNLRYLHGFFHIEVAYGKPRLVYVYKNTGESDVSPRLPAAQMLMWLQAAGVAGLKARYKELKKGDK